MKFLYLILLFSPIIISHQKTTITVLYESLCPDSEDTIFRLYTSYEDSDKDNIQLEFVPYGKANHTLESGRWQFTCQHFREECDLNKYHACGLKYINGQNDQLNFVRCMMTNVLGTIDENTVKECSHKVKTSFDKIQQCFNSDEGTALMVTYGNHTNRYKPLDNVPTILYNNTFHEGLQENARDDPIATINHIKNTKKPIKDVNKGFQ
ncbi:hypothetical protein Trydic_g21721 [Trypoxylus dichotomus]